MALPEYALCRAVREASEGLVDASLGGGLVKKRIPVAGRGKRGGGRVIIATNLRDRWFLLAGFRKNERDDVSDRERSALQNLAADLLRLSDTELAVLLRRRALREICHDDEKATKDPDTEVGERNGAGAGAGRLH